MAKTQDEMGRGPPSRSAPLPALPRVSPAQTGREAGMVLGLMWARDWASASLPLLQAQESSPQVWSSQHPPSHSLSPGPGGKRERVCMWGGRASYLPWEFPSLCCWQDCFILNKPWGPHNFSMKGVSPPTPQALGDGMQEGSPALPHLFPCSGRDRGGKGLGTLPIQSSSRLAHRKPKPVEGEQVFQGHRVN